jgi:Polyketide cyclase / dehydrase and lipid transport
MARAYASSVINAPIDKVWDRIRDFNALANWHPAVAKSAIEGGEPSGQVGCVRVLTLQNGATIREQLLEMSDLGHHYSYSILEGPLPVANYRATLRLRRISDGNRTYGEWSASFDPDPPEKQEEAEDFVSNAVFQGGFDALKKHFGG